MRLPFLVKLVGVVCLIAIASRQAFSCQCGGIHGKDAWEVAKKQTEGATVIFEGTPDHFEWQWYVLGAKAGELIPANDSSSTRAGKSRMLVTFRVTRAYKGDVGSEVQISTGLGGGDCGAVFATGLTYLVYAYGSTPRELDTSMCDPGGWIGSRNVLANLRYLREQRPLPADLTPGPWWAKWSPEKETQQQHEIEEFKKRYAAVTGRICGTVSGEGSANGIISFLSTQGYSPVQPIALVNQDGSFCSERLGPGKYYAYFTKGSENGALAALYYPGGPDHTKATTIEVTAGQDTANLTFKIPSQKTYPVYGFISTNDKSGLTANDVSVALISLDGARQTWYSKAIDFQGSLPLPKLRFFTFENVVPGRYIAYVSASGKGWLTKKVEMTVSTHMQFISLELVHTK